MESQIDVDEIDAVLQAATTPPPGFGENSTNDEEEFDLEVYGESLRMGEGAFSAPPPPGFRDPEERRRGVVVSDAVFNATAGDDLLRDMTRIASKRTSDSEQGRTTSFDKMAAALGKGLAESMDGNYENDQWMIQDNLSYARQSRHAASRLMGSSSPGNSPYGSKTVGSSAGGASMALSFGRLFPPSLANEAASNGGDRVFSGGACRQVFDGTPGMTNASSMTNDPLLARGPELSKLDSRVTVLEPIDAARLLEQHVEGRSSAPPSFPLQDWNDDNSSLDHDQILDLDRSLQALSVASADRHSSGETDCKPLQVPAKDGSKQNSPSMFSESRTTVAATKATLMSQTYADPAEEDLKPFIWDAKEGSPASRGLVIFRCASLPILDVRSLCEAFGVMEAFRADFVTTRGVIFVLYLDIRSAQFAAQELSGYLGRLPGASPGLSIKCCVPLNASSALDESLVVFTGADGRSISPILKTYGELRSFKEEMSSQYGSSVCVEFFNIQDARQAVMELESTQPWGPEVSVELGARSAPERKSGRNLLALMARWRQENGVHSLGHEVNGQMRQGATAHGYDRYGKTRLGGAARDTSVSNDGNTAAIHSKHSIHADSLEMQQSRYRASQGGARGTPSMQGGRDAMIGAAGLYAHQQERSVRSRQEATQVVLGPDGQYSYMVMDQHSHYNQGHQGHGRTMHQRIDPRTGHVLPNSAGQQHHGSHGMHGNYSSPSPSSPSHGHHMQFWNQHAHNPVSPQYHPHHFPGRGAGTQYADSSQGYSSNANQQQFYQHMGSQQQQGGHRVFSESSPDSSSANAEAMTTGTVNPRYDSRGGTGHAGPNGGHHTDEKDNRHLVMDIATVESGKDRRTSLMVRNIPNKYTQQMLLAEFEEHGHGPGKIDFFYLPIDFKNKCNRGYAFVNFVDYRDIVNFHRQYAGQHWKVFNSDKICDITYARIQGKSGMLKRFENSALMEKDDEYKPLVFVSHGPDKGKRMAFAS